VRHAVDAHSQHRCHCPSTGGGRTLTGKCEGGFQDEVMTAVHTCPPLKQGTGVGSLSASNTEAVWLAAIAAALRDRAARLSSASSGGLSLLSGCMRSYTWRSLSLDSWNSCKHLRHQDECVCLKCIQHRCNRRLVHSHSANLCWQLKHRGTKISRLTIRSSIWGRLDRRELCTYQDALLHEMIATSQDGSRAGYRYTP